MTVMTGHDNSNSNMPSLYILRVANIEKHPHHKMYLFNIISLACSFVELLG